MNVHPLSDPNNLFPKVLTLGLGDWITVTRTAPGGGTGYSQQAIIEWIEHTITPGGDWHTIYRLSPADSVAHWVLADSRARPTWHHHLSVLLMK